MESGTRLGPYEILSRIGEGGMGAVYKARDTRLNRTVAIKKSAEAFSERFEREAQAIAAVNHPHICTLYDVGPDYLVMELVEGKPLSGPLPVNTAVRYAMQIAAALDAAHRKGITHRDLKPANILVTKAGVKLLDFGLAKRPQTGTPESTQSIGATHAGTILGTPQYMSPEQVEGREADARSDIFSFGAVLYELVTGEKAFQGNTPASVMAAVLRESPPALSTVVSLAPPALDRLVKRCLEKDPDDRFQTARDVLHTLEDLAATAPAAEPAKAAGRGRRASWVAAAFAAGMLVGSAAYRAVLVKPAERWESRPLTFSGRAYAPAISPDGKQVAFFWSGPNDGDVDLYLQLVGGGSPLLLSAAKPAGRVAWSPDGNRLAIGRPDGVYVMPSLGGAPRRISGAGAGEVAWSPNGAFLVIRETAGHLSALPADGGDPIPVTKPGSASDRSPAISPDSRTLLFVRRTSTFNSAVLAQRLSTKGLAEGDARSITSGVWDIHAADWSEDGRQVLFSGGTGGGPASIWQVPVEGGAPVRLVTLAGRWAGLSAARQGGRVVYDHPFYESRIIRVALSSRGISHRQVLVQGLGDQRDLGVSPDGSRIAFASDRTGSKELWVADADGSNQVKLTAFEGPSVGSPRWSPDGTWVVFDGYASGSSDIYSVPSAGGSPKRLTQDPGNEARPSWSHDGQWIYFGSDQTGSEQVWKMRPDGSRRTQVTNNGGGQPFESSDGRWLYARIGTELWRMRPDGSEGTLVWKGVLSANYVAIGGRRIFVYDSETRELLAASHESAKFEKIHRFEPDDQPVGGGNCIAVPRDESSLIYRYEGPTLAPLMVLERSR